MIKLDPKKIKQVALDAQQKNAEIEAAAKLEAERQKQKDRQLNKELLKFEKAAISEAVAGQKTIVYSWNKEFPELLDLLKAKKFTVDKSLRDVQISNESKISDMCANMAADLNHIDEINDENLKFVKESVLDTINEIRSMSGHADNNLSTFINEKIKDWHESIYGGREILDKNCVRVMKRIIALFRQTFNFSKESEEVTAIFSWRNHEWISGKRDGLLNPRTLNWISSGTGQAFIKNITETLEAAASNGLLSVSLEVSSLGVNELRWGTEEAFKVVNNETPLGAIPFDPNLIAKLIKHFGFQSSFEESNQNVGVITICW
jgi:hypothetical protein